MKFKGFDIGRISPLCAVTVSLSAVFLIAVQSKIMTYVCGNDPMLYIRAARTMISPSLYGLTELRNSFSLSAPGYAMILGAAIECFGSLSPYWVNLVLFVFTLPLMWAVLRRLMGSDRAASFSILATLLMVIGGRDVNAPFLLYPFREVARQFFVYLAFWLLLRGVDSAQRSRWWFLGSGAAVIIAVLVREPSVLIAPCLLLGLYLLIASSSQKWRAVLWLVLPWITAGIAGALLLIGRDLNNVSQFSVLQYFGNFHVAVSNGKRMIGWFPSEATWAGLLMILIGILRAARKQRALLAFFLLPAILFFAFYSYMQVHHRYFITSFMFLAVFAGYGLDAVCLSLCGRLKDSCRRNVCNKALTILTILALVVGLGWTADTREVWGPHVSAKQVRQWQNLLGDLAADDDGRVRVAVEQRCRYLEDMILSYSDVELLDPKNMNDWPKGWQRVHYFKPMNKAAHYATPQWLMWLKVYAHRIIADRADLVVVESDVPRIGEGVYSQYSLTPWRSGVHVQPFELPAGSDCILWLDWGGCNPDQERTITVSDVVEKRVVKSVVMKGNGLQALLLPASQTTRMQLEVSSEAPLPLRPLVDVALANEGKEFSFGVDRCLSLNRLVLGLDDANIEEYPFGLAIGKQTRFRAPSICEDDGSWIVSLSGVYEGNSSVSLICKYGDGSTAVREVAAMGGTCTISVRGGETVELSLASSTYPGSGFLHIERVSFAYRAND